MGCSTPKVHLLHEDKKIEVKWQKIPLRFAHRDHDFKNLDKEGVLLAHPFFDIVPGINSEQRLINMFTIVPEDSLFKYNFDLYSGKLYKDHDYCPSRDISKNYSGELFRPNFIQGIVPRVYNEMNLPQKIILFADKSKKEKFELSPSVYSSVRIIGSFLLEKCQKFPCDLKTKWEQSQILVAVDPLSIAYSKINSISEIKKIVDWGYVQSILVNQDGAHQLGSNYFPINRFSKEFNLNDSFSYFNKNSKLIKMEEVESFRDLCFKLYDEVWEKVESIRQEKSKQQEGFFSYFKEFYGKNSNQFNQCQKLVRPANINENDRRFWFFTYLQAFINLEKNGFYFSCSDKSWSYNPKIDEDHSVVDQNKELTKCHAKYFEKAFDMSINELTLMKNQVDKGFHFIEYDTQHGGSHQKIYGWIEDKKSTNICNNENTSIGNDLIDIFPEDIVWQNFLPDNDVIIH